MQAAVVIGRAVGIRIKVTNSATTICMMILNMGLKSSSEL